MAEAGQYNLIAIGQGGRLQYQALLLAASWRKSGPVRPRLYICEPQPGPLWPHDPRMEGDIRAALSDLGADVIPFESRLFGHDYPYGNKIEALSAVPDQPFIFLDTDTLIMGDMAEFNPDFTYPCASMRREGTWPKATPYGPSIGHIWRALYTKFGLDFEASCDFSYPVDHWRRYLYFNAGWFLHESPARFGAQYAAYAAAIRDEPLPELVGQNLDPWLDQVALPLVIHTLKGGRPGDDVVGLDGALTCHWRRFALLYARESAAVINVLETIAYDPVLYPFLKRYPPLRHMVYEGGGVQARGLFDQANLPSAEMEIRQRLRAEGLWLDE